MKTLKDFAGQARGSVETVAPAAAHAAAGRGALVLDVREAAKLAAEGRVPGACHVPRGTLEPKADPDAAPDARLTGAKRDGQRVLTLCASGMRALLAAHTLGQMGYDAAVIEGGMKAWKEAGLPVED